MESELNTLPMNIETWSYRFELNYAQASINYYQIGLGIVIFFPLSCCLFIYHEMRLWFNWEWRIHLQSTINTIKINKLVEGRNGHFPCYAHTSVHTSLTPSHLTYLNGMSAQYTFNHYILHIRFYKHFLIVTLLHNSKIL